MSVKYRVHRFDRPGKKEISTTVFDVVELHNRHLTERIERINTIRQAHGK